MRADDCLVELGGARLRALTIRLALDAGRPVPPEALVRALWPERSPANPSAALYSAVSRLRQALPDGTALRFEGGAYLLEVRPDDVDVHRFERLASQGRRALRAGEAGLAGRRLREALALWRGPALAEVSEVPYAAAVVVRLEELRLAAVEDRVEADLLLGAASPDMAAELAELTAAHPLRERLLSLHVRVLHALGRVAEALSTYADFRRRLVDELGADPGPELREAHLAVLRATSTPKARPLSPRGNLRLPLTSFVGREQEREDIRVRLAQARLVTLVGPGGVGKTRLATTVAAEVTDAAWLVDLAVVADPSDVPHAVATTLGLRELLRHDHKRDPVTRLVEAIGATDTLVVLDNCEHLLDAAARLVEDLLGRCSRLTVIATSREPLGLAGEALCVVPSLPLRSARPAEAGVPAWEESPAMRLFVDRAAAASAGFALTADNAEQVAELCRRLDGLPLAIELAAVRLRAVPLEQLTTRLSDRFRFLTGGSRTALPRHQTLRAVVAWSFDLLDVVLRGYACWLAVFPAAFSQEAAAGLGVPPEALDTLVEKSLLQLVDGRYRMLETIREYAMGHLAATGEVERAQAAHAAYFLELAEEMAPRLRGSGQLRWLRALTAERDNLLAALHHVAAVGDAATAARLGAALSLFWTIDDGHAEAASRLRTALDVPGHAPADARLAATAAYLFNAVLAGHPDSTRTLTRRLREERPERSGSAVLDALFGLVDDQVSAGLTAIDRSPPPADPWLRAMLAFVRSMLHGSAGEAALMRRYLAEAVAGFREVGERCGLVTCLTYLGVLQNIVGEFEEAVAGLTEAAALARELGSSDHLQRVWLARVRMSAGDFDTARAELLALLEESSFRLHGALARLALADVARHCGDLGEAGRQLDLAARERGHDAFEDALFRASVGQLALARGELDAAEEHLAVAFTQAVELPDLPLAAAVAVGAADLRWERTDGLGAARTLGAAHTLRGDPDAFHPDVVRLRRQLTGELGADAYDEAYERGRSLGRDQALAVVGAPLRCWPLTRPPTR
ncbi:putative ATPase [Actinopolymorpha pittospori]|uniref:ATPase n=1 Tax=Actinopolymorpha pittospori TaxID=648752 RepID=A0A927RGE2_9ACTN|nr:putative ATPase [Actinopolymorpha pittospori]